MQQPTNPMQKEEWEEELKRNFYDAERILCPEDADFNSVKSFISTQISLAKSQERQRIVEVIKESKKNVRCGACDGGKFEHLLSCKALTDIINTLTEQK